MKTDLIWFGCISLPRHFGIFVIFGEDFTEVCMEGEQHNDCLRIFEDQDKCDFVQGEMSTGKTTATKDLSCFGRFSLPRNFGILVKYVWEALMS